VRHGAETSAENGAHGALAEFSISIHLTYKGKQRTYLVPLTSEMIKHLGLEAELQYLTMGELITRLTRATLENITR